MIIMIGGNIENNYIIKVNKCNLYVITNKEGNTTMDERITMLNSITDSIKRERKKDVEKETTTSVTKLDEAYSKVIETLKEKENELTTGTIPVQLVDILHDLKEFESNLDGPRKLYRLTNKFTHYDSCEFKGRSPIDKISGKYIRYHSAFEWNYSILKRKYRETSLRSPLLDAKFRVVYAKMINILIDILKDLSNDRYFISRSYRSNITAIIETAKAYLCVRSGLLDITDVIIIPNCKHPLGVLMKNSTICCKEAGFTVRTISHKLRVVDILDFAGEME